MPGQMAWRLVWVEGQEEEVEKEEEEDPKLRYRRVADALRGDFASDDMYDRERACHMVGM